jgi:hypothetical protein
MESILANISHRLMLMELIQRKCLLRVRRITVQMRTCRLRLLTTRCSSELICLGNIVTIAKEKIVNSKRTNLLDYVTVKYRRINKYEKCTTS